ncbi:MAG: DUF6542 domain-containing protein [Jatrophihabitantaceae bacterium]
MPYGNGASFVSDQPDTSYYRVPGQRSVEPSAPVSRGERPAADARYYRSQSPDQQLADRSARRGRAQPERGLPGWLAVLLLIAIAGASGLIDSLSGSSVRGVFNYGLVLASLVAILVVRRSGMFPVVVAPPLVYFVASASLLYIRTGGLRNRGKLLDAATNWIVYGFPAIAGATAVVLVIAGFRLVTRR